MKSFTNYLNSSHKRSELNEFKIAVGHSNQCQETTGNQQMNFAFNLICKAFAVYPYMVEENE